MAPGSRPIGKFAGLFVALVALGACAQPSAAETESIRAVVSSLQPPPGWVQDGGVAYDCESVNLDCSNSSSGAQFTRTGSVADACAALVSWVTAEPSFVEPSAVVGLDGSAPPSADDCRSEIEAGGRYFITASGPSSVSTSDGLGWELLVRPSRASGAGLAMSVVLGDPPEVPSSLGR